MPTSKPRPLFASATLLAVLLSFLPACSTHSTRPENPPSEVKPEPPRVDCNQPSADDPPPHPRSADLVAWTAWAIAAYHTIADERSLDRREEQCIADLKKKGVIR